MNISTQLKFAVASLALFVGETCSAADTYLTGTVKDITSISLGILLKLDTGVPTNCASTPYGWMIIRAENKSMTALFLTMYAAGNRSVTVYTSGVLGSGYCEIHQYDPIE